MFHIILFFSLPAFSFGANHVTGKSCTPVITIKENKNNVCLGSTITFKSAITNNGSNSIYQWKKNNVGVGTNNSTYTAADFKNGDIIICEYSCTSTCGTNVTVKSNAVNVHIIDDVTPVISVANQDSIICQGELTHFTTQAYYGDAVPSYLWKVNNVPVGNTLPGYTTDSLTNGSKVECVLTISTPSCPSPPKSTTSWLTIYVYPMIHPAVAITPSNTNVCRGEQVTFTAAVNGGDYPSLSWEVNGIAIGYSGTEWTTGSLHDGDTVSCTVTIDLESRCHTSITAPSNKVIMHVKDYTEPAITINAPVLETCAGKSISFTATAQNTGDYISYQWIINDNHYAGTNTNFFVTNALQNGDKIHCLLTTDIPGCSFSKEIPSNYETVTINDTPVITFTPPEISILSGETAALNASVTGNISSFKWTPAALVPAPQSLVTNTQALGDDVIFNLEVTNAKGCISSNNLPVKVLHQMFIPNAFTPNGDGNNDVFKIPTGSSFILEQFLIYDRWGKIIFTTKDISKGWDGTYHGFKLKTGAYVYQIKGALNEKKMIKKGTVLLLR